MKRIACLVTAATLIWIFAAFAAEVQVNLLERVSLDLNTAPPQGAFDILARTLNCEIVFNPQVQRPVTIRLENVTARTALDAICESIGCKWRLEGRKLIVDPLGEGQLKSAYQGRDSSITIERLRKPLPAGTRFNNAPLSAVMQAISAASGLEIQLEEVHSTKMVTADLSGQTLLDAIKSIVTLAGIEGPVMIGGFDDEKNKKFRLYIKGKDFKIMSAGSKK